MYVTAKSVSQTEWRQCGGMMANDKLEMIWEKVVMARLVLYTAIGLEELRKVPKFRCLVFPNTGPDRYRYANLLGGTPPTYISRPMIRSGYSSVKIVTGYKQEDFVRFRAE
jgi:hypothetical protein